MVIKWTNKCSGEQGFVKTIKKKEGHFVNTFEIAEAKSYSPKSVKQTINLLEQLCGDNTYEGVDGAESNANAPPN